MPKYLKFDRNGAPIEDDDDILRDGQRLVVPMNARDGMSPLQRAVAEDVAARSSPVLDALGGTTRLHQPGPRYVRDQADARERVEQARAEWIREMCDAWRTPDADSELRGQQPGDQCTINGAPGHLNERLECVPDQRQDAVPRMMDSASAQAIKDAAYAEMVNELVTAWQRKPVGVRR